jgi:hypothetical protein
LCHYFAIADPEIHALVSNGRRGKQRILYLKCQACGGCRTSRFGTPLYWLKTPLARITMVMTALSEGVDISAAGRIFGHHHTTITRWLERCGRHRERLHERLFPRALRVGHLQLDELVTKVKTMRSVSGSGPPWPPRASSSWHFISVAEPRPMLIICSIKYGSD